MKWSITHSIRTSLTSKLMKSCNLQRSDEIRKDLSKSSISQWSKKLNSILDYFGQCTNPFSKNLDTDKLYNIPTGQSVSEDIDLFLSSIEMEGKKQRKDFISESMDDPQSICKTSKNAIVDKLLKHQKEITYSPEKADIYVYDSHFLLETLKKVPITYSQISLQILQIITKDKKEIHIIFEKLKTPSIKDYQSCLRGEKATSYAISAENRRTVELSKLLISIQFQEKFVEFLINDWKSNKYAALCDNKTIKINFDKYYSYTAQNEDSMAIVLAVRYIFTGIDYNPSFYRKSKRKAYTLLKKNVKYQKSFLKLVNCNPREITTNCEIFKNIQEFVCKIYGLVSKDVNEGRTEIFEKNYKFKLSDEKIIQNKSIGCDATSLPPTNKELIQQIYRSIYISSIWCNAHMKSPSEMKPEENGWTLIENTYEFLWFDGPMSPSLDELTNSVLENEAEEEDDDDDIRNEDNDEEESDDEE
ncbi:hypothetical protein TKK_0017644 [Trichogramma kaykai]